MRLRWTPTSRRPAYVSNGREGHEVSREASMDATVTASCSRPQHPASSTVLLDGLLQARPSREPRDARSRDLDPLAGRRITSLASASLRDAELAKPRERHIASAFEGIFDRVQESVDRLGGILLAESGTISYLV